jgi:hydroxymethylbilane synthase
VTLLPERVIIGTRGSKLALWQANWVAEKLRDTHPGLEVKLQIIKTTGDRFQQASLAVLGGKGAFTKEIQDALLERHIDVAVHSLKDLPTQAIDGLRVWAHPRRFDPRDAWLARDGRSYDGLPERPVIATGALRRRAQLLHRYPGAVVEDLRGNVDTRLAKLREGNMHGMFLACAGLMRLDRGDQITEILEPGTFLPAPGQGALAIEARDEAVSQRLLAPLDDPDTRAQVTAERAFLATLEGGCQVPIAALATLEQGNLQLDGLVASPDGDELLRDVVRGPREEARTIGEQLARELIARGGDRLLEHIRDA